MGFESALLGLALASQEPITTEPHSLSPDQVTEVITDCREFGETGSPRPGLACLSGAITEDSVAALNAIEQPWRILVTNSQGGDLRAGIEIGRILNSNMAALVVDTICLSSCANYLVPGSRYLYVAEGSVIALHGSAPKTHQGFASMRASALGHSSQDFLADPNLVYELFDQFEAFRQDFVIPEADFFVETYTDEGYLNRYWEVERTLDHRPNYKCAPTRGLFLIPGPIYLDAFSVDVVDMWWPEDRTELLGPIEPYLDNYSVIADFDEHPIWDAETGLTDPETCETAS